MLVTTTSGLEGRRIVRYLGPVSGEAILGINFARDIFASVRDFIGGRSNSYEQELNRAKEIALNEMVQQAQAFGANAVDLDSGTAIVYEDL